MKSFIISSDKNLRPGSNVFFGIDLGRITSVKEATEALEQPARENGILCLIKKTAKGNAYDCLRMASTKINSVSVNKVIVLQVKASDEEFKRLISLLCQRAERGDGLRDIYETACDYCNYSAHPQSVKPLIKKGLVGA